jgi:hypothetical protein
MARGLYRDMHGDVMVEYDKHQARIPRGEYVDNGIVTFANFTCQPRCAHKGRTKENQSFGALDVGAKSTENGYSWRV